MATPSNTLFYATLVAVRQLDSEISVAMGVFGESGRRGRADHPHAENLTDPVRFPVRGVAKATNPKHSPPLSTAQQKPTLTHKFRSNSSEIGAQQGCNLRENSMRIQLAFIIDAIRALSLRLFYYGTRRQLFSL